MDELEERKSFKGDRKYKTGHTYRRLRTSTLDRLNKDNYILTNHDAKNNCNGYKGISINKNKNWLLNDTIGQRETSETMFKCSYNKNMRKTGNESNEIIGPISTTLNSKFENKRTHTYTFYHEDNEMKDEGRESSRCSQDSLKTISRKARRREESRAEEKKKHISKDKFTVTVGSTIEHLGKGKCWISPSLDSKSLDKRDRPHLINTRNSDANSRELIETEDDLSVEVKNKKYFEEYAKAKEIISYFLFDKTYKTSYKPILGEISFKSKDGVKKEFFKNFYSTSDADQSGGSLREKESEGDFYLCHKDDNDDEFYICEPKDWSEPNGVCDICNNDQCELIRLNGCDHETCKNCWRVYTTGIVGSPSVQLDIKQNKIKCCYEGCDNPIDIELLGKLWNKDELKTFLCQYFDSVIRRETIYLNYLKCNNGNCDKFIIRSKDHAISVCECNNTICNNCLKESHLPLNCHEASIFRELQSNSYDISNLYIEGKNCPNCGVFIEKSGGCQHMICFCSYHFCWDCLEKYQNYTTKHRCKTTKSTTLSIFTMERCVVKSLTKRVNTINTMQSFQILPSSISSMIEKLKRKCLDTDRICFELTTNTVEGESIGLVEEPVDIDNEIIFKSIYIYLRKILFDLHQFSSVKRHAYFRFITKCETSSLKWQNSISLTDKMIEIVERFENWNDLRELMKLHRAFYRLLHKNNSLY